MIRRISFIKPKVNVFTRTVRGFDSQCIRPA